jgi:sulfite reductase (NADPH) hemoprotein beta-component
MSLTTTAQPSKNEQLKARIPTLAGTIAATLADPATDRFSEDDEQFIKFHGIYQQDDRDLRKTGKKYQLMIRGRIPGGVMTAAQWRVFDELASRHGNDTLRVTTRQSLQFHGVVKAGLGPLIRQINEALLSTLAACGDVNRNVMAPPTPATSPARALLYADSVRVAEALAPVTQAYHAIWVEGVQLNLEDPGHARLHRPALRADLPAAQIQDRLRAAAVERHGCLHQRPRIHRGRGARPTPRLQCRGRGRHGPQPRQCAPPIPRLADVIGFVTPEHVIDIAKAVIATFRDFGDRVNRKHARFKYVVEERGTDWVREEISRRAGVTFAPARPYEFTTTGDLYGWHRAVDGSSCSSRLFVETGRIKDVAGRTLRRRPCASRRGAISAHSSSASRPTRT